MTTSIGSSTSYPATVPALSEVADIQVALRLLAYGSATDPANDAAISTSSVFGKIIYRVQPNVTAITSTTATLTIAQLLTYIVQVTQTAAVTLTLPTGSLSDAGVQSGTAANNTSFDWSIINTGTSLGAITVNAGTNHTLVGSGSIAIGTSARFRTRKTATNTFVTYRIG